MSKFHFLNVTTGDCHLIQHNGPRVSMIDICNGNASRKTETARMIETLAAKQAGVKGNFNMAAYPTQPLDYLDSLGISEIWRFILTHPDMDHMDGLDALLDTKRVLNYWDTGARREKPDFNGSGQWREEDWSRYESIINNRNGELKVLKKRHGDRFEYANEPESGSDGLHILAPNQNLIDEAGDKCNRTSYVILYRSPGGKILIPGDAEDSTWEFVLENYRADIENCSILVAPHHGRDSDMDFSFLKVVNPQLVLMGNAKESKDMAYHAYRNYNRITNNQAGNVVCEAAPNGIDVYVENETLAETYRNDTSRKNSQGYTFIEHVSMEQPPTGGAI